MKFKIKRIYLNEERTKEIVLEQFNACYIFPILMLNFHHNRLQEASIGWLFWSAEFRSDESPAYGETFVGPN